LCVLLMFLYILYFQKWMQKKITTSDEEAWWGIAHSETIEQSVACLAGSFAFLTWENYSFYFAKSYIDPNSTIDPNTMSNLNVATCLWNCALRVTISWLLKVDVAVLVTMLVKLPLWDWP
jgi:hypothetical protein